MFRNRKGIHSIDIHGYKKNTQNGKGVEVAYFRQKPCGKCDLGQNHGAHKAQ